MHLIEGKESPEELIALAWMLEEGTRVFYEKAKSAFSDREAEKVFDSLIAAEQRHRDRLSSAYSALKPGATPKSVEEKGLMEGGVSVDEALAWLGAGGVELRHVLEVSMQLETNSLDFYMKFQRNVEDGSVRDVLGSLIEEEKAHLRKLGDLLNEKLGG